MRIKGPENSPTAIHMVRMLASNAKKTADSILAVRNNTFPSIYRSLRVWISKGLGGYPIDKLMQQGGHLRAVTNNEKLVKAAVMETLPLIEQLLSDHSIEYFHPISEKILYQITTSVKVPIAPLGYAKINGRVCLIFAPTWENIELTAQQFRIWATIIHNGAIKNNPDYDGFVYINTSKNPDTGKRELNVRTDIDTVDLLTPLEFSSIRRDLDVAMGIVRSVPRKPRKAQKKPNDNQTSFNF